MCEYVNIYQKPGSSHLTGWKFEVGVASLYSMTRVNILLVNSVDPAQTGRLILDYAELERAQNIFKPRPAKTCLRAYVDSEGLDQPAHSHSLIRVLLSTNRIIGHYRMCQWGAKKKSDETLRMGRKNLNLCILRMLKDTIFFFCIFRCL